MIINDWIDRIHRTKDYFVLQHLLIMYIKFSATTPHVYRRVDAGGGNDVSGIAGVIGLSITRRPEYSLKKETNEKTIEREIYLKTKEKCLTQ